MDLKNNFAEAFNNLGNAMKELKKFDESLKYLTKAIQIKSDYAEAYNNLGILFMASGQYEKAAESYKKAIKVNKNFIDANEELLLEQFNKENNFQTNVRGIKIRGVYETRKEADIRAKVLSKMDKNHKT